MLPFQLENTKIMFHAQPFHERIPEPDATMLAALRAAYEMLEDPAHRCFGAVARTADGQPCKFGAPEQAKWTLYGALLYQAARRNYIRAPEFFYYKIMHYSPLLCAPNQHHTSYRTPQLNLDYAWNMVPGFPDRALDQLIQYTVDRSW